MPQSNSHGKKTMHYVKDEGVLETGIVTEGPFGADTEVEGGGGREAGKIEEKEADERWRKGNEQNIGEESGRGKEKGGRKGYEQGKMKRRPTRNG